ncbi:hypothetical protein B0H63DRAFT_41670 [Podospora didyma]|uniref:Uncharacterized protein n=1 Tax=Podospora didyma TaxID=330526 RepID=A0AAE0U8D2_9PEZI|nr:hypothetical protein B0H63DRAFT_41670 [Podospora didyma]
MFGSRRHRPPNPPLLTSATADPNAATAAAAVFRRHESNPTLSAAAAAAALRARPMTPTLVGEVQTKRTMRRSASIASTATVSDTQSRPDLRRRGSSSSMAERTFRSPSPHRPNSSGSGHRQSQSLTFSTTADMPPVPALPARIEAPSHRKTTSLGMSTTPLRLASERLATSDATPWFGVAKLGDPNTVRREDPAMASPPSSPPQALKNPPLEEQPAEQARSSSRSSSVNFSYPARARVGSPTASPVDNSRSAEAWAQYDHQHHPAERRKTVQAQQPRQQMSEAGGPVPRMRSSSTSDETLVYDPNSRRMVRQSDLLFVERAVQEASLRPTGSKRRKQGSRGPGSHLSEGTMGRNRGTTLKNDQTDRSQSENPISRVQRPVSHQPPVANNQEYFEEPAVKAIISSPRTEARRIEQHRAQEPAPYSNHPQADASLLPASASIPKDSVRQTVRKQPSLVKEELEPTDSEPERQPPRGISAVLDAVPTRQRLYVEEDMEIQPNTGHPQRQSALPLKPAEAPESASTLRSEVPKHGVSESLTRTNIFNGRTHSNSPVRQAHFAPVQDSLMVKHSPPPRSISPRKSAMKINSPSRGASPSDDTSETSGSYRHREEPTLARKKSVRVSFDDENTVVVGEAAPRTQTESPVLLSPQNSNNRRSWYGSIGRNKIPELARLDDDEVMKPRPALPSFGSVRDKKPRELTSEDDERPLVRPVTEPSHSPSLPASPALVPSNSRVADESKPGTVFYLGQSTDHAVGAVLSMEQERQEQARHAANISRFREPLPPVVTSVEGSGYISDSSSSSSSSEFEESRTFPQVQTQHLAAPDSNKFPSGPPTNGTVMPDSSKVAQENGKGHDAMIPTISISLPSPPIVENKTLGPYFVDVPGGFPDDESDPSPPESVRSASPVARELNRDDAAQKDINKRAQQTPVRIQPPRATIPEPESDSESSIYSDAYEDLSDLDGDGFLSLDAVVESPLQPNPRQIVLEREPDRQTSTKKIPEAAPQLNPEISSATTLAEPQTSEPQENDWEKAKAFWRGLTAEKRAQLEKEALEDAGIDGDLEGTKPTENPRKKKSIERRNSERKALAVHMAQQMIAEQGKRARQEKEKTKSAPDPERKYMIEPGTRWLDPDSDAPVTTSAPAMRTTLRSRPQQQPVVARSDDGPRLRKSMRTSDLGTNVAEPLPSMARQSDLHSRHPTPVYSPAPAPTGTGKARQRATGVKSQSEPASRTLRQIPPPIKRRDSSDSESSFKRVRPTSAGGGFTFRKSMRQTSPTPLPTGDRASKRFSLRSLSPTGSPSRQAVESRPVSATTSPHMRHSLRDSSTERKSATGMRMPTFSLTPGGKKASGKRASKSSSSRFSSRFDNSSDEDVGGARGGGFRSRFEESSDEEPVSPMPLTVSRAPPAHLRNQGSIASTALPEELEETEESNGNDNDNLPGTLVRPATSSAKETVGPLRPASRGDLPASHTAPALGNTTLVSGERRHSSSAPRRSSLMSVLRRKKHGSTGKISRGEIKESAARRDTNLERNVDQLRDIRKSIGDDVNEPSRSPEPPRSPRLQKRIVALARAASSGAEGLTPLSEDVPSPASERGAAKQMSPAASPGGALDNKDYARPAALKRPTTSGNLGTRTMSGISAGGQQRPGHLQHSMSAGVASVDTTNTTTKKKRFGALRRMFGLHN